MEQLQKLTKNKSNGSNETYRTYRTNVTYAVLFVLLCSFFVTPQKIAKAGILSRPPTNLGLVGYWPMDEGAGNKVIDASGQGNTGTITGATWTNGKHGKALSFNGVNDVVALSGIALTNTHTVSMWINPTLGDTYGAVFSQDNLIGIYYKSDTGKISFYYGNTNHLFNTALNQNAWNHIIISSNSGSVTFYLNGVPDGVESSATGYTANTIGDDSSSETFKGKLDDIRIYNRALTATEISKLYSSGGVRTKSGPSLVQTGTCLIGGNTCTINITSNAGNLLWVGINDYANTVDGWVYSISDTKGNSYLTASPATDTGNVNAPQTIQTFYAVNVPAGANTITCSRGAHDGGSARCTVLEYSGLATVSPFDGHLESTVSGTNYTSGNLTTTNSNDLLIGYFASRLDQSWSGLSWTSRFQNNIDFGVLVQDKLVSSKGAYSVSATASNSAAGVIATNAFKSASGSTKMNSSQNNKLTNGLVGLWSFNGGDMNWASGIAYDRSGQGNNGTITNMSTSTSPVAGKLGQALRFDGVDDYVRVNHNVNQNSLPLTISVWAKAGVVSQANNVAVVSKYPSSAQNGWAIDYVTNAYRFYYFKDSSNYIILGSGVDFGVGTTVWTHLVAVVDNTGARLYRDGTFVNSQGWTGTPGNPTQASDIQIGRMANGSLYWNGSLDEVRIYNRALSADEVKQLYNMGK